MEWTVVLAGPARKSLKRIPAGECWGEYLETLVQLSVNAGVLRLRDCCASHNSCSAQDDRRKARRTMLCERNWTRSRK